MNTLLDRYHRFLKHALTVLMGLMIIPVTLQIVSRQTGLIPRYIWTEEIARFCFIWIIMIGSMIAVRDGAHFDVDLLPQARTDRHKGIYALIVHVAMGALALFFLRYGIAFAKSGFVQNSEMSGINMLWIYISFPIAGFTWLLFLAEKVMQDLDLISDAHPDEKQDESA